MKSIAENRRARFDYEISETLEAGIELKGFEVKSAKAGRFNIAGSRVIIRGGEARLVNSQIPPYQPKNTPADYDASRPRRLLLRREELKNLIGRLEKNKSHLIPLNVHLKNNLIKLELGLARPRKKSDQREVLKKRAHEREIRTASD